jgi:hypothetical protein
MSKRIDRAIRKYQASVTPEAITGFKKTIKARGARRLTAAEIRVAFAMQLRATIDEEINGH